MILKINTASSIGVGNHNIESVESNSSALNIHNRIQLDSSLITGNDVYISPTGGLTEDGPYACTLLEIHHSIKS